MHSVSIWVLDVSHSLHFVVVIDGSVVELLPSSEWPKVSGHHMESMEALFFLFYYDDFLPPVNFN